MDSELVVPHLSAALIGDSQNKLSAIKGLSRWRSAETRAALVIGLKDVDQTVRREAASSLTKMGFLAEVTTQLMQELSVTGADRAGAIRGLGTTHSEQALPVLLNQLKDQDPSVRTETILALTEIGFKERTIGPMKLLLDDADLSVRIRVIDTLARLGERLEVQRLSAIIRSIEDNGLTTQLLEQALFVARLLGSEDAARAMIGALDFDDPSLRNRKQAAIIGSIAATRNAPKIGREWHFDFNRDGNPSEIADNARTLSELKAWLDSHP